MVSACTRCDVQWQGNAGCWVCGSSKDVRAVPGAAVLRCAPSLDEREAVS
jgi:hypothetical protein